MSEYVEKRIHHNPTNKKYTVTLSPEDAVLFQFKWGIFHQKKYKGRFYVQSHVVHHGQKLGLLHRVVLKRMLPELKGDVGHISLRFKDGNGLNCTRNNIIYFDNNSDKLEMPDVPVWEL